MSSERVVGVRQQDGVAYLQTRRLSGQESGDTTGPDKTGVTVLPGSHALGLTLMSCRPGMEVEVSHLGMVYAVVFHEAVDGMEAYVVLDHEGYCLDHEGQAYDLDGGPTLAPGAGALSCGCP